jgi:RHS repeat-associated protein
MRFLIPIIFFALPITSFSQCITLGADCLGSHNVNSNQQYIYYSSENLLSPSWIVTNGTTTGPSNGQSVTVRWSSSGSSGSLRLKSGSITIQLLAVNISPPIPYPLAPSSFSQTRCGAGSVTFTAAPGVGETTTITSYKWYRANGSIISGATGSSYTTNPLDYSSSTGESYSVAAINSRGEGSKTDIDAIINPVPGSPVGLNAYRCDVGSVLLSGTPGTNANSLKWYNLSSGGETLTIGNTYTTPALTNTTTYYITSYNTSTGCESTSRIPVVATISPLTIAGSLSTSSSALCLSGTVTLTQSGHTGTVTQWMVRSRNGAGNWSLWSSLSTENTTSKTYAVSSGSEVRTYEFYTTIKSGSCASANTNTVEVVVNPATVAGTLSSSSSAFCSSGVVTLTQSGHIGNVTQWMVRSRTSTNSWSLWSSFSTENINNKTYAVSTVGEVRTYEFYTTVKSGNCTDVNTNSVVVTVDPQTVGGALANSIARFASASGVISLTGSVGTVQKWQSRSDNGNWEDVSNTAKTYSYNVVTTTTFRAIVKSGVCATTNSNEAVITIYDLPVVSSNINRIVLGQSATLNAGEGFLTYLWRNNEGRIVSTNQNYTTSHAGTFTVTVTKDGVTGEGISSPFVLLDQFDDLNQNYIVSNTMYIKGVKDEASISNLSVNENNQSIQYFDGLGRPMQSVSTQASPNKADIAIPIVYDAFGRESKKYLPFASGNDGWYKPNNDIIDPLTGNYTGIAANFYNTSSSTIAVDAAPYSVTTFEPSPLNRVLKQGAPGTACQPDANNSYSSTDHTVKFAYEFNQANEVLLWTFTYPTEEYTTAATNAFGKLNAGTTAAPTYYAANQLYKNKTKDEEQHEVIEYVDKEGRTVLKRVQVNGSNASTTDANRDTNWASTYYLYDDFGNLVCVIPPEATKRITQTSPISEYLGQTDDSKNKFLKRWAFRYRYDGRRRMAMKQVPGAEPVYMVYDNRDRLVLTQDGVQRSGATIMYWSFTKYDELNRPIATGIKDTSTHPNPKLTQLDMQNAVNAHYAKAGAKWGESYIGNEIGNVHGYSNKSYPVVTNTNTLDVNSYLTVTYYDHYDFRNLWVGDYAYKDENLSQTVNDVPYNQPDVASTRVIGQLTGSKTKVLDGGMRGGYFWLKSVNYYDDKYRVVQTQADNYKGGIDLTTNLYDFVGKVLKTQTTHNVYWKDVVGTEASGNNLIKKYPTATWGNSGAASISMLKAGQNGWMEVTVSETNTYRMIGFSDTNVDVHYTAIDYALYLYDNRLLVYENGSKKHDNTAIASGDVLRIERTGTTIKYYKNGTLVYTSATPSATNLLIDVAFYHSGGTLKNVRSSFDIPANVTSRRFEYDHAGRLINTWHSLNGATPILLAHNEYNELGQLIDKKLHSTTADASDAKQSVDYRYNIRGWLTSINNAQLINDPTTNDDTGDYFGMELGYNNPLGTGNSDLYNGNISGVKWSNNQGLSSAKQNAYNYSYDPMNRILAANFKQHTGTWGLAQYRLQDGSMQQANAFSEAGFNYDLNGNIKALARTDYKGTVIDQLDYNYGATATLESNKLLRVTDVGDDAQGFKEVNNPTTDDYTYDTNGNLVRDRNKDSGELLLNGSFDSGNQHWTVTDASNRLTFSEGKVNIIGGASSSKIMYPDVLLPFTTYLVTVDMMKTGGTDVFQIRMGSSGPSNLNTSTSLFLTSSTGTSLQIEFMPTFTGYINSISVANINTIAYNYLNLPEFVKLNNGSIQYIYTASGQKLSQVTTDRNSKKQTDYAGEYIYQNDTLQFINHEEGRIVPPPAEASAQAWEYQYNLKDHLGNVRTTFTTKQETDAPVATLETANTDTERANFLKYDDVRKVNSPLFDHTTTSTTQYAVRLTGTQQETYGLARSLAVVPGDKIKAEVFAKYVDLSQPDVTTALRDFIELIVAGSAGAGVVVDGGAYGSSGAATIPHGSLLNKANETGTAPKAYLNWLVFDKNFMFISSKSGYRRLTDAAKENGMLAPEGVPHEKLESPEIEITEPGFVYIYLSNEEPGKEVYFDDFKVTHTKSPVIQSDDYYPFGLTFNSYSRENSVPNKFKFQGQEHVDDLGLNWDSFKWRNHQPDIGRFFNVDPLAEKYYYNSPYAFSENKVVAHRELEGLEAESIKQEIKKVENVVMPIVNKTTEKIGSITNAIGDGVKSVWNYLKPGADRGGSIWTTTEHSGGDQSKVPQGKSDGGGNVDALIDPTLRADPATNFVEGFVQGIEMVTTIEERTHVIESVVQKAVAGDNLQAGDTVQVNTDQKPGTVYPGAHGREYKQVSPYKAVVVTPDTINTKKQ